MNDALVGFGVQELKAGMINSSEVMAFGGKKWKTTQEMLRMGEKNSHDQNNYERMVSN